MARKRLSLTSPFGTPPGTPHTDPQDAPLETKSATPRVSGLGSGLGLGTPPIARVAAEVAGASALEEMTRAWSEAREGGRMVQALPLEAIDETWLVRDRLTLDTDEMGNLIQSLRDRGQQVPIEVVALENGRFGLISGWRRLRALKVLSQERGADSGPGRFGEVLALLRRPSGAAEAYRAMVEENEIRAGLSYYERARIAHRAAETGAFDDARAAVNALFAAGSRAKRSKIGSFLAVVEALDDRLSFGWAIPERLGLGLAKALDEEPDFRARLRDRLRKATPDSAEAEMALLTRALSAATKGDAVKPAKPAPRREELRPGLWLETGEGADGARLTLGGARVDAALQARLTDWLKRET